MPVISIRRQLGQKRPATVSASKIYSPPVGAVVEITSIFVTNTTGSGTTFSIYQDKDGANYATDTAIYLTVAIGANVTTVLTFIDQLFLENSTATLGVQAATAGSLNFTVYGIETIQT